MARRGDELDAEAAQVEDDRVEHVDVRLARVAAPGTDLAQLEGAAEQAQGRRVERRGELRNAPVRNQVGALPRRQAVVALELHRSLGTSVGALDAEQAAPEIHL